MRGLLVLTLAGLLLAGCSSPSEPPMDAPAPSEGEPVAPLPPDIDASDTMPPSVEPSTDCGSPTATCFRYPFTLGRNASVAAELSWDLPANDLDLLLLEDGGEVAASTGTVGTFESIEADLGPGSYELVVHGYASGPQPFRLQARFSE